MNSEEKKLYLEIFKLSREDLRSKTGSEIEKHVEKIYLQDYEDVNKGIIKPKYGGRSREQCQELLANGKNTLINSDLREDLLKPEPLAFPKGGKAETPEQLARLIDRNWDYGKHLLYSGTIASWLEGVNQGTLANVANRTFIRYAAKDQDKGLEYLVQRLNPRIGRPVLQTSLSSIDFGTIDTETKKTIRLEIENTGRGFLYGDVKLASGMPGLQISSTEIRGRATVEVELNASRLMTGTTHETKLIIQTNGGELTVPISCYVDYPMQKSIRRVVISSLSMGAIALVARWIVLQSGGFRYSWLTSAKFVSLDDNWLRWFEWPVFEWQLYIPHFAGFGFVIAFSALVTGIFFYFKKRGPG